MYYAIPPATQATYKAFSLTWPVSIQIYWNQKKRLNKKTVQLPQDWFGTTTWPPFHCFETPIWPPWRQMKTLFLQGSQNKTKGSKKNALAETDKRKRKKFPEQICYCYRLFSFLSFFVVVVLFCLFVFSKSFHFF